VWSPESVGPDAIRERTAFADTFTFVRALPSDISTLETMFGRCSFQSRLRRFFRPVLSAPHGYLEEVLADRENHYAFVVQRNDETIGLAELHLTGPRSGALALIIEDPCQRKGVGTAALQLLARCARELGLETLAADVLFENAALLPALRRLGPTSIGREDDIFHVELDLESPASGEDLKVS
jgi:RimJ/RimL family protein N-acetyltransferase